jgi:hypothetical protein
MNRSRVSRAVESFRNAADTIGAIEKGMALFAVTRGQFSMLDMVLHALNQIGPAHVSVWTWAIAEYEVEAMCGLMARTEILSGTIVIDQSAEKRNPVIIEQWRKRFDDESVKICRNHAKIARVWNDGYRLLLRGSLNLNWNPRYEQLDITEGGPDFDLVTRIESELKILPRAYSNADVESASGLNKAWEHGQLQMFAGTKTWQK